MNDKEVTHEESLQIIQQMIEKARYKVTDDGFHFMLWGILVFIASLVNYVLIKIKTGDIANIVWIIMPITGGVFAWLYERNKKKITRTQSYADKVSGYVWLSFGITLGLTIFIAIANACSPIPYILALTGLATFISGRIMSFLPFTLGGVVFWLAAIGCIFVPMPEQVLVNGIAILIGYIAPGFAIWRKYKSQERVQALRSNSQFRAPVSCYELTHQC